VRREATKANSAATKKALAAIRKTTANARRSTLPVLSWGSMEHPIESYTAARGRGNAEAVP